MPSEPIYRSRLRFIFESIEGVILFLLIFLSWPITKKWFSNWGTSESENAKTWPGDHLTPDIAKTYTRAININATREKIWKLVTQFGLDRAGFYSYELFERIIGIPVKNVETVLPKYQSLKIGETIKLHPDEPEIPIGDFSEGEYICFGTSGNKAELTSNPRRSWSIYIMPCQKNKSRLILRSCREKLREPSFTKRLIMAIETPIDFLMEQRMMRTIRRLAEQIN